MGSPKNPHSDTAWLIVVEDDSEAVLAVYIDGRFCDCAADDIPPRCSLRTATLSTVEYDSVVWSRDVELADGIYPMLLDEMLSCAIPVPIAVPDFAERSRRAPKGSLLSGFYKDGRMQVELEVPEFENLEDLIGYLEAHIDEFTGHAVMSSSDHLEESFLMELELGAGVYRRAQELLDSYRALEHQRDIYREICDEIAHYIEGHGDMPKEQLVEAMLYELRRAGTPSCCGLQALPEDAEFGEYRGSGLEDSDSPEE